MLLRQGLELILCPLAGKSVMVQFRRHPDCPCLILERLELGWPHDLCLLSPAGDLLEGRAPDGNNHENTK